MLRYLWPSAKVAERRHDNDGYVTFFDENGIIRKALKLEGHDRDRELEYIMKLESDCVKFPKDEQGIWYIVESSFVRMWLQFVGHGTASFGASLSSPVPPPINNEPLLMMAVDTDATIGSFYISVYT